MQYIEVQVICGVNLKDIKKLRSCTSNKEYLEADWPFFTGIEQKKIKSANFHKKRRPNEEKHWRRGVEIEGKPEEKYEIFNIV